MSHFRGPRQKTKQPSRSTPLADLKGMKQETPSFAAVMEEHWPSILRFCRRVVQSDVDAEELAQQTFYLGYRAWSRFEGRSSSKTWLFRIAINACRRFVIASQRRQTTPLTDPVARAPAPCRLERNETNAALHRALREISPAHRAILTLFYLEGLSGKEVVEVLGCSEGTMWSRLYHARRALEHRLCLQRGSFSDA